MSIPGSTNGSFNPLIYFHGDADIHSSLGVYDTLAVPHGLTSLPGLCLLFLYRAYINCWPSSRTYPGKRRATFKC